ncbi:MAG TPA: twin-arginine translocation signal domain-containing protein [Caldilineae bacterium]|nr:twin-arginine translocation signal domain-containing protein [Caldilineae bacterium]
MDRNRQASGLSRRQFLKYGGAALAASVVGTTGYLALSNESGEISVERILIPIRRLPPALEGFTIAQLSDIHLLPYTRPAFVAKAVAVANSLNPDLTVLTGDYVWRESEAMFELAPLIAALNARYGVYGILGNHDYWLDVDLVKAGFREARIPLLINEHIPITLGGSTLVLAGLDDGWAGRPDLDTTLAGAPADAPVVLLLHEPDLADVYGPDGRSVLQLAGHSHGGQVRLPGSGALVLPYLGQKYDFGLYRVNDMWLYTNRGLGNISVPLRLNCTPEVTLFTLVRV